MWQSCYIALMSYIPKICEVLRIIIAYHIHNILDCRDNVWWVYAGNILLL